LRTKVRVPLQKISQAAAKKNSIAIRSHAVRIASSLRLVLYQGISNARERRRMSKHPELA
jgi:hypothetical protein